MPRLVLVGEAYGENEELLQQPFVGAAGIELLEQLHDAELLVLTPYDRDMIGNFWWVRDPLYLSLVWKAHPEIFLTNVFNLRPDGKNNIDALCGPKAESTGNLPSLRQGKYIRPEHLHHVERLAGELRSERPNLAVALGNTAAWALLRTSSISKIRGTIFTSTLVEGLKVLPTYHPAAVLRQYELRHVTILDLIKARREARFAEIIRPRRQIYVPESLADMEEFYAENIELASTIAVDIETASGQITCIGFSTRPDSALVVPLVDPRRDSGSYWAFPAQEVQAWEFIRRVLDHPAPKVFQNGLYDLHFLYRGYGIVVRNCEHDTMLLHHALQPESPKGLGYLGSIYTNEPAWKLMRGASTKRDE